MPDLPNEPSLQQLRHQARDFQRAVRRGDQDALAEVARRHPAGAPAGPSDGTAAAAFPLSAAQLVVARRYDFPSWVRLRRYVEVIERYSRFPDRMTAGPDNPAGNAWVARERPLETEADAQRLADSAAGRTWLVVNESVRNAHGRPVGYQLVPGPSTLPPLQPDAPALRRAQFATRHLWVTAYDPAELHAAGDYPYQHAGGAGLPAYTRANRPVRDTDIVVWHTFVAHHVVRPEDWPVMPVTTAGFQLRPFGYFDANPALDLPRPHADHCASESRRDHDVHHGNP